MKQFLLLFPIVLLTSLSLIAQCPEDNSLYYETQMDIDTFKTQYPNCQYLHSITLVNSTDDPITDLSGFDNIDSLQFNLTFDGLSDLEELNGFDKLRRIRNFTIKSCSNLKHTDGFDQLNHIAGTILIENNPLLEDIRCFENVNIFESKLSLIDLPNLIDVDPLQAIKTTRDLTVSNCDKLTHLGGLANIENINGDLLIEHNEALTELSDFDNLIFVEDDIIIENNPVLESITDFNKLETILDGIIEIRFNNNLSNIEGFNALVSMADNMSILAEALQSVNGFNALPYANITFSNFPELLHVTGFTNLQIAEDIRFEYNPKLIAIPEFNVLDSITWGLSIQDCPTIQTVSGFDNLRVMDRDLLIVNNALLTSLPSFPKLKRIKNLNIERNPRLQQFDSMPLLDEANRIEFDRNDVLTTIPNFNLIDSLVGLALINDNPLLSNCPTFQNLTVANSFYCLNNPAIEYINSCPKLDSVESLFWIIQCDNLKEIEGFDNLRTAGGFGINQNSMLEVVPAFNQLQTATSYFQISDNASLNNIEGFNQMVSSPKCEIINNGITNITGFQSFENGLINILNNDELIDILGFEQHKTGNIFLESNTKLNQIPTFNNLDSNLYIQILDNPSLSQISGFQNLRTVRDIIIKDNSSLETIAGFDNLESAWEINLDGNMIISIPEFNSLLTLGNEPEIFNFASYTGLYLENMPMLGQITGFENLDTLKGWLQIVENNSLQQINAFPNLKYIYRNLIIFNNQELLEVDGFQNLEIIGSNYMVRENNKLKALPPTTMLHNIKGQYTAGIFGSGALGIEGDSIASLSALQNLQELEGQMFITNTNIERLAGLENIDPSLTQKPHIKNNPRLSDCAIAFLCQKISEETSCSLVENNAEGCNSCEEVDCTNNSISGFVFYDFNENKVFDEDEVALQNIRIQIEPDQVELLPRSNGQYVYNCIEGETYSISTDLNNLWKLTTDNNSYDFEFQSNLPGNDMIDFGVIPAFDLHAGELGLSSAPTRCNTDVSFHLSYKNIGTYQETGEIILNLDPQVSYIDADPIPSSVTANQLIWNYEQLKPFQGDQITLDLSMPDEASTNDLLEFDVEMHSETGLLSAHKYSSFVLCSYDPNDKLVMPADSSMNNYIEQEELLTYTVRFQNDGNAEAINIYITDTIDANLDLSTLRIIDSSFPVQTTITNDEVRFDFENIWLPSSQVDLMASQGYVTYRISPYPDLNPGQIISNEAFIYFDSNAPIQTNQTISTIKLLSATEDVLANNIGIYPNPAKDKIHIDIDQKVLNLKVFKLNGQSYYNGNQTTIDVTSWPIGFYLCQVITEAGIHSEMFSISR